MSDYQLKIADEYNISTGNVKQQALNFLNKQKYVLHYKKLKLHYKTRIKIKKVHCVLELNQSEWLKPYAKFNT